MFRDLSVVLLLFNTFTHFVSRIPLCPGFASTLSILIPVPLPPFLSNLKILEQSTPPSLVLFSSLSVHIPLFSQFSHSVMSNSLRPPWIAARQASLSIMNSQSLPKLTSIKLVMPSSHLILCVSLFLLLPIPPSIRVFSNESILCMKWPKYWSFSFLPHICGIEQYLSFHDRFSLLSPMS